MGEIADAMLDGEMCEGCGDYLGEGDGFPRRCRSCAPMNGNVTASDMSAKKRRWLTMASSPKGVWGVAAQSYLPKLAKRGFLRCDEASDTYFITDAGRAELERISRVA